MNTIDPIKLQRLIDGELDTRQVQEILAAAKSTPNHWEEIATSFVEDQIWKRSFQSNAESVEHERDSIVETQKATPQPVPPPKPTDSQNTFNFSWLAIAAAVLMASGVGYMAGQIPKPGTPNLDRVAVIPEQELNLEDSAPKHNLASASDDDQAGFTKADYHFHLPEDSKNPWNEVAGSSQSVPLYRVKNMEQYQRFNQQQQESENSLPPELFKQLSNSGYQMEKNVEFISGRLGDGRSFVVPVQTIRFDSGQ